MFLLFLSRKQKSKEICIHTAPKNLQSSIPFIVGGLGEYLGKVAFGAGCAEHQLVDKELQKYAQEQENCYYVTAKGLFIILKEIGLIVLFKMVTTCK
ncbi:hypothetical protein SAMN02927937_02727 [Paenimyroides aquimaris]|uniref:Uncharacterized protein n=1 Tax=Paenimyroides marinum TaxID=1159016 RepID=A0A1H6MI70_9FLAO|nr:hypothetical protein [Paenimyroides aquimaris]SEI01332.1 hypothetical protein SAMN02927937_02727 [Paenimyroides aquimaris]